METGNGTGAARIRRIAAMITTTALLICGCALTSVPAMAQDGMNGTTSDEAVAASQATQLAQTAAEQSTAEQDATEQRGAHQTEASQAGQSAAATDHNTTGQATSQSNALRGSSAAMPQSRKMALSVHQ